MRQALLFFAYSTLFLKSIFAHSADERSHQEIKVEIFPSGGNIQLDIYCGPKLSQTFLKAISSANLAENEKSIGPSLKKLLHIEPWVQVLFCDLNHVLKLERAVEWSSLTKIQQDPENQKELFRWLDTQPIQRYHLLKRTNKHQRKRVFPGNLDSMDKPEILSYLPSGLATQSESKELLLLHYRYWFTWPEDLPAKEGVTCSVETTLKSFTSNSVFDLKLLGTGNVIQDSLSRENDPINPSTFLSEAPSKKHKVRRLLFHYASP